MNNSDIEGRYYCNDCKSIIRGDTWGDDNHRSRYLVDEDRYEWMGSDGRKHHVYAIKQIRCPHCGNWGAIRIAATKELKCISCTRHFQFKEGAFMDGIFLDKNPLLKQRAEKYIHEGCRELDKLAGINGEEVEKQAVKLYKELIEKSPIWEGYNPRTTAAGILYIAGIFTRNRVSQRKVADIMNCTEVSIRKYKAIAYVLDVELIL